MNITDILNHNDGHRKFSIEVLPPLKGNGTEVLFHGIDRINDFNPQYINITTHHSEYVYRELENASSSAGACAAAREPSPLPRPYSGVTTCP